MIADPTQKIGRSRKLYSGPTWRDYVGSSPRGFSEICAADIAAKSVAATDHKLLGAHSDVLSRCANISISPLEGLVLGKRTGSDQIAHPQHDAHCDFGGVRTGKPEVDPRRD